MPEDSLKLLRTDVLCVLWVILGKNMLLWLLRNWVDTDNLVCFFINRKASYQLPVVVYLKFIYLVMINYIISLVKI